MPELHVMILHETVCCACTGWF